MLPSSEAAGGPPFCGRIGRHAECRGNPYAKTPLCIAQVDPATGRHARAFFFLGATPRAVLEAARSGRGKEATPGASSGPPPPARPSGRSTAPNGGRSFPPEDPPESEPPAAQPRGAQRGEELDFGDLGELEDLDIPGEGAPSPTGEPSQRGRAFSRGFEWEAAAAGRPCTRTSPSTPRTPSTTCVSSSASPRTSPCYRQHLFYYVNEEGPVLPYRLAVDGAPVAVDWRGLAAGQALGSRRRRGARRAPGTREAPAEAWPQREGAVVAGLAVDPHLEERREGLRVEALDTFTLLGPSPTSG